MVHSACSFVNFAKKITLTKKKKIVSHVIDINFENSKLMHFDR